MLGGRGVGRGVGGGRTSEPSESISYYSQKVVSFSEMVLLQSYFFSGTTVVNADIRSSQPEVLYIRAGISFITKLQVVATEIPLNGGSDTSVFQ